MSINFIVLKGLIYYHHWGYQIIDHRLLPEYPWIFKLYSSTYLTSCITQGDPRLDARLLEEQEELASRARWFNDTGFIVFNIGANFVRSNSFR